MKSVTKTYKFIYTDAPRYAWQIKDRERINYTFGNRMPDGYDNKIDVYRFFYHVDDFTMRKHFTNKTPRRGKDIEFLPSNVPANEANITLAFVKYFTHQLNTCRRKLTFLNKNPNECETLYNAYNPAYYSAVIREHKANLAIWKARYEVLKAQGVYTYMELMK